MAHWFVIYPGQKASYSHASGWGVRLPYRLNICADADDAVLPDRCLVCSQPVPSLYQRRTVIHFSQSVSRRSTVAERLHLKSCICVLAHQYLLMFIFIYQQEAKTGRIKYFLKRRLNEQSLAIFRINTFAINNQMCVCVYIYYIYTVYTQCSLLKNLD